MIIVPLDWFQLQEIKKNEFPIQKYGSTQTVLQNNYLENI